MMILRYGAFINMALAIVAAAFAPVAPDWLAGYAKAAAGAFTGLAGLFLHPPEISGTRDPSVAVNRDNGRAGLV